MEFLFCEHVVYVGGYIRHSRGSQLLLGFAEDFDGGRSPGEFIAKIGCVCGGVVRDLIWLTRLLDDAAEPWQPVARCDVLLHEKADTYARCVEALQDTVNVTMNAHPHIWPDLALHFHAPKR
jgi:hypothetical protein